MSMDDMSIQYRTETENWLLAEFHYNSLLAQADQGPTADLCRTSFWPYLNPYYSPLNAIYTPSYQTLCAQGLRPKNEKQQAVWMLRDGVIPLAWFFLKYLPEKIEDRILVHADLAELVPRDWAEKVLLYRHRTPNQEMPDSLLISGPVSERVISLSELDSKLAELQDQFGKKKLAAMKVQLYCPIRGEGESYPARYFQKIYSVFDRVSVLDWFDIENIGSLKGVGFVELNGGWMFKDSFVQQHVLSRGAMLISTERRDKRTQFTPLSRFHGVDIEPFKPRSKQNARKRHILGNFFLQTAGLNDSRAVDGPWPNWHEKWYRAMYRKVQD